MMGWAGVRYTAFAVVLAFGSFLVFALPLRRHSRFASRCAVALGLIAVFYFVGLSWREHLRSVQLLSPEGMLFSNLMGFSGLFVALLYCCEVRWQDAVYGALWGVMQMQCCYEILNLIRYLVFDGALGDFLFYVFWLGISAAMYLCTYYLVAKKSAYNGGYFVGPRQLTSALILTFLFFFLFDIFSRITDFKASGLYPPLILAAQVNCISVLYMQIDLFRKAALEKELDTLNVLYTRQQEQYAMAKQNVRIINRKCHELKMQIAALRDRTDDAELKRSIQQAEESIHIYDSITNTGNKVLDTLLTEKSLLCGAREIKINCVADGAQLDFMTATDLYALFAEAVENAIDEVSGIEDPQRRIIDVQVYRHQNFVVINIANPLCGEQASPPPPKPPHLAAGWGIRAMRNIAQKYGGILSAETENGMFVLRVVVPGQ